MRDAFTDYDDLMASYAVGLIDYHGLVYQLKLGGYDLGTG